MVTKLGADPDHPLFDGIPPSASDDEAHAPPSEASHRLSIRTQPGIG